jgi:hypothetical protein
MVSGYEDETLAWTPRDQFAVKDAMTVRQNFSSDTRPFLVFLLDKNEDNLLTVAHFSEIKMVIDEINNWTSTEGAKVSD